MRLRAARMAVREYRRARFACCTKREFWRWWVAAMAVMGRRDAAVFCEDCPLAGRREMASRGLCIRERSLAA